MDTTGRINTTIEEEEEEEEFAAEYVPVRRYVDIFRHYGRKTGVMCPCSRK